MELHSTKSILWTAALLLFLASATLAGLQWPILWVPGALLTWYGLLAEEARGKIAVRNRSQGGLN